MTMAAPAGTDGHMPDQPLKRASKETARANPSMPVETRTLDQKVSCWNESRGGSLDSMGLPVMAEKKYWTRYTE